MPRIRIYTADEFISINPWFNVSVDSRIESWFESNLFRTRVKDLQASNFGNLFRQHAQDSQSYNELIQRLRRDVDADVQTGITRINNATENKVNDLVNNGAAFEPIRLAMLNSINTRTSSVLNEIKSNADTAERLRDERLKKAEADISNLKYGQMLTFTGGAFLGAVSALAFAWR